MLESTGYVVAFSQRLVPSKATALSARWPLLLGFCSLCGEDCPRGDDHRHGPLCPLYPSGGLFQYFSNGCVVSQSIVFHTGQSTCVFPNCQVLKSYSWPDVELRWFFFLLSFTWQFQQSGKYTYTRIGYFCCRNLNINGKSLAWPFMSLIVWTLALLFLCGICHHRRQDDCLLFILTI